MTKKAFLHFGDSDSLPMYTVEVPLKHEFADKYKVLFDSKWRRVFINVNSLYINYEGKRIKTQIEGV